MTVTDGLTIVLLCDCNKYTNFSGNVIKKDDEFMCRKCGRKYRLASATGLTPDFREGFQRGLDYAVDAGWPKEKRDSALKLYDGLKDILNKKGLE